jgi:hypothetical protein
MWVGGEKGAQSSGIIGLPQFRGDKRRYDGTQEPSFTDFADSRSPAGGQSKARAIHLENGNSFVWNAKAYPAISPRTRGPNGSPLFWMDFLFRGLVNHFLLALRLTLVPHVRVSAAFVALERIFFSP